MPYVSTYTTCDDGTLDPHYVFGCEDVPEKGRIRRGAWIHSSVIDLITASPTTASVWNAQKAAGKIIVLPELSGTMDGGTPKLGTGFGDVKEKYQGSDFKATIKDENYIQNWPHYRSLIGKSSWYFCFVTETQGHITGNPVTVAPKNPITENIDDSVIWEADITWFEYFTPAPFLAPAGVFTVPNVIPPTAYDSIIVFSASATPAAVAGVSGTASEIDAQQKLEFNAIASPSGLPISMLIKIGTTDEATFDTYQDYVGQAFRYTDKSGNTHTGSFIDGTVTF